MNNIDFFKDIFSDKQPSFSFKSDLEKDVYGEVMPYFGKRDIKDDEVYITSATTDFSAFEHESLETVYHDFSKFIERFLEFNKGNFKFTLIKDNLGFEHFRLEVTDGECKIYAGDTEGVRRALYFIEDEIVSNGGPYLKKGITERKPFIKDRITRNFSTPHEANLEFKSDEDFYSDGYLNRLAHEGINGVWVFTHLREFVPSEIIPEYGKNGEKIINKLNETVKKCARYGIKVYALGVEPYSTYNNKILFEKHSDMLGDELWGGNRAICPSTKKGAAYIEECMYNLFTLVPGLAGFIGITSGEAVAGCGCIALEDEIACPHCREKGLSRAQALAETERLIKKGIEKANKNAKFISWTYAARGLNESIQRQHLACRDHSIPLMNNFEDKGVLCQLGKDRITLDYWLSFRGPGEVFENIAKNPENTPLYAKIQACNSHELATVPYVPVPGILYDKYEYMNSHNIEGVMYCWFFGNYPSVMNKAASELSFEPFCKSKDEFLLNLASLYVKKEDAHTLAKAWKYFEEGYENCPYNVAFSWFGPINDAIARPYHLIPKDIALPSNWILSDSVEGDRFGEFCGMMHTPEETVILLDKMLKNWKLGLNELENIAIPYEMQSVAEAIYLLIKSAKNIMQFYIFRNNLGYREYSSVLVLNKMENICEEEISNTLSLLKLCESDPRLGYHSEAVGFKFFPEKLLWRAKRLENLLNTEFSEVRERIAKGLAPLAFFEGENAYVYDISEGAQDTFLFTENEKDNDTKIKVCETDTDYIFEIYANHNDPFEINAEFRMFVPYVPIILKPDGTISLTNGPGYFISEKNLPEEIKKWQISKENNTYKIVLNKKTFGIEKGKAFRISVKRFGKKTSYWHLPGKVSSRLMYGEISPEEKVFIF